MFIENLDKTGTVLLWYSLQFFIRLCAYISDLFYALTLNRGYSVVIDNCVTFSTA